MELYKEVENIRSKEDFTYFLSQLINDYTNNNKEWENKNIGDFISAMKSWVEDMEGYYKNNHLDVPTNIDWNFFANVLFASRIYE